jgi:polyisoprenyl-phosphate glycosyltransferase
VTLALISVSTPCFNEGANIRDCYEQVRAQFARLPHHDYEHVFIDNASTDETVSVLRKLARSDPRVRVIVNSRNFGVVRSGFHGFLQCRGDAVITMAADLQDPPALIPELVRKWEEGNAAVLAVKRSSAESKLMYAIRSAYYRIVNGLSDVTLVNDYYGFGLYDRRVVEALRLMDDPYPYFRGQVAEAGFRRALVSFDQPVRTRGSTSYNFYRLYDVAMLGITSHSKVPLRLATMVGFAMAGVSALVGLGFLVAKLLFWQHFTVGIAPIIISIFFLGSVQLFFTGVLGEYIGFIYTHVRRRPLVLEEERINFDVGVCREAPGQERGAPHG